MKLVTVRIHFLSAVFGLFSTPPWHRDVTTQARIHTGFHRFTEIGHIFHTKYIFNNKKHFPS